MKFKPTPKEHVEFLADNIADYPGVPKKMFGAIAYFVNGNMFAGAFQDAYFIRIPEHGQQALMNTYDEITRFEPMPGKKMKEYLAIPESLFTENFREFLDKSYAYARALPKKQAKKTGRAKGRKG